ncbi:MAG: tRNA (adenosine(37)-N6)-threonylcarbamoyltransferase complex ATPase subunit type 1 TsaE [Oscillibacter sp.]|nr:tRNA (adenosine(37)-N6)-threonylcarbamoyltransferase complex ATPase subunit type 1 TsaE [Oscillibacter sp.]
MKYISHSETETEGLGQRLAALLPSSAVVAYHGGLGMGKTAFTRGLARGMGYTGRVTSPTFTIVNEYRGGSIPVFHFDAYRLSNPGELWDIGFEDYLTQDGICVIEWSEQIEEAIPEHAIRVAISRHPDNENWRMIQIEGVEAV